MNNIHYNSKLAKIILPSSYKGITIFGHIFFKQDADKISEKSLNHEKIHVEQQHECFWLGFGFGLILLLLTRLIWLTILMPFAFFYIWYGVEYIIALLFNKFINRKSYRTISFEQEAYENDDNELYIKTQRDPFDWMFYIGQVKYKG